MGWVPSYGAGPSRAPTQLFWRSVRSLFSRSLPLLFVLASIASPGARTINEIDPKCKLLLTRENANSSRNGGSRSYFYSHGSNADNRTSVKLTWFQLRVTPWIGFEQLVPEWRHGPVGWGSNMRDGQ